MNKLISTNIYRKEAYGKKRIIQGLQCSKINSRIRKLLISKLSRKDLVLYKSVRSIGDGIQKLEENNGELERFPRKLHS